MPRIEPRPGIDVYVNQSGTISIAQLTDDPHAHDRLVVVHPENVRQLIRMLKAVAIEARQYKSEAEGDAVPPALPAANG